MANEWLTNIKNELSKPNLLNPDMNQKFVTILNESTLPKMVRSARLETIRLVAFGGHSVTNTFYNTVLVAQNDKKRLFVSAIIARHTANFIHCIHKNYCDDWANSD